VSPRAAAVLVLGLAACGPEDERAAKLFTEAIESTPEDPMTSSRAAGPTPRSRPAGRGAT